jgi:hypothetical protein
MTDPQSLLQKLEQRQEKLRAQIRKAKADAAKKAATLHNERCRLIGDAVITEMEHDPEFMKRIMTLISHHTTNPKERKLLGLSSLPQKNKGLESQAT